ncbi:DNA processing protein [Granulibacter bethesdensis CGDNIH1]|uniref:DNA processing protein n=2 Tax=Granulibacter bethesdensis TaxID=364410 RepID=Q0BTZ9_GRABC|nr:DNA processing protein [Granulibacter bethesdensis CGDNIH1]APH51510.1 DNA processing protein [Granulibacter bethesdensis]APH64203.1 DNA processing protein [Granulibacter bethesdensis]
MLTISHGCAPGPNPESAPDPEPSVMTPHDALDRLRLARTEGIGPTAYGRLITRFRSAGAALRALPGLPRAASLIIPSEEAIRAEMEALQRFGGRMIFLGTPDYPAALAATADPPPVLSVLGDIGLLSRRCIAMVGGRNSSINGRTIAGDLSRTLASAGLVVVSGLARGIDTAAHIGAMETGLTIAVVAGGLDCPYPRENIRLQSVIAKRGAVISELPLGTAPIARHFPRRNRIIAGLSEGVILVEAALQSGSLITARCALEAGREIFAVPGSPLDPRCRGSNDLLRQGAWVTETAEDVLNNLPVTSRTTRTAPQTPDLFLSPSGPAPSAKQKPGGAFTVSETNGLKEKILLLLGPDPVAVDDLIRRCQLSPSEVVAALLEMELSAHVVSLPGNRVARLAGAS